jgi:outer membrane protein assembly factor BamB
VDDKGDLKHCGVAAFDVTGKKLWHFKTDSGIKNNIAAANGRFFATSVAGWLYALDESSGKLLWKAELDRERERWEVAATTAADGAVYVGRRSYIAAFDEKTGKTLWEASEGKNDWWPSSYTIPTVCEDKLLLHSDQGAVALDTATGRRVWKADGKFNGCLAANGVIYTLKNGSLTGLSPTNGMELWSRTAKIGDTASVPAISGDKIVVGTATGEILALSGNDGVVLWTFETSPSLSSLQPYKRGERDVNSSPAIHGDKVFTGASDGVVYALSLATGEKMGCHQLGVPIASSPLIHDGILYIGGYDGNLYAFEVH